MVVREWPNYSNFKEKEFKVGNSSHELNFGMTKDEEEVFAVGMPFERKMDYFD